MFSNLALFNAIHRFAGGSVPDGIGYFIANDLTYLLVIGAFIFLWRVKNFRARMFAAIDMLLAVILSRGILTTVIRHFYTHPRPFVSLGFIPLISGETPYDSFPSGHMTALFALAIVMYFLNRKWGAWYLALSLLVGVGRIYAGVHWPLDILGGIAIGVASGLVVHGLLRKYWQELKGQTGGMSRT